MLNLRGNRLQALPWAVSNLLSLSELYLDQNELDDLPPAISQLQNLIELHLSHNRLRALPEVSRIICVVPSIACCGSAPQTLQLWTFFGGRTIPPVPRLLTDGCMSDVYAGDRWQV